MPTICYLQRVQQQLLVILEKSDKWCHRFLWIFIKDMDEGIEGMLIRFVDDTKLGEVDVTSQGRIQNDLSRLENGGKTN